MGRKPSDYSKTIIYKIRCNDENVIEFYVGSTTCFRTRKNKHKSAVTNDKQKLYEMIRSNGGWENWTMTPLEEYPCNSSVEARIREECWRETLQAKLNSQRAYLSDEARVERGKQYHKEHFDEIKANKSQYYQNHADKIKSKRKQYYQNNIDEIKAKAYKKFECDCGSICVIPTKARHERTLKHQNWEKTNKNISQEVICP